MRALVLFTLQRELRTNMHRTQPIAYSPQPGCSGRPAGCVSGGWTFVLISVDWVTCNNTRRKVSTRFSIMNSLKQGHFKHEVGYRFFSAVHTCTIVSSTLYWLQAELVETGKWQRMSLRGFDNRFWWIYAYIQSNTCTCMKGRVSPFLHFFRFVKILEYRAWKKQIFSVSTKMHCIGLNSSKLYGQRHQSKSLVMLT